MSAFTNFLNGVVGGLTQGDGASMRDYQHADRLYVQNNYARAPKLSFLYFIVFNISQTALATIKKRDATWASKNSRDVGLLVKRADLPKFTVGVEVLNQYNRKTVVQNKITYNNVSFDFHDDNSDITNDLWKNYYEYYYMDPIYGSTKNGKSIVPQFKDTKLGQIDYYYGLDNAQTKPFFDSIDIYVLHKGHGKTDFTQYTLVNPVITEWAHDTVNQDENGKPMVNKMTLAYEAVFYNKGKIKRNSSPPGFVPVYYDRTPSPLHLGGSGRITGPGGIIAGAETIFGSDGLFQNAQSPLDYIGAVLQTRNLVKSIGNLKTSAVSKEGYSIAAGSLSGAIGSTLAQPFPNSGAQGNNGITMYNNYSVNEIIQASPVAIINKKGP